MEPWVPNFSWVRPTLAIGGRFPPEQAPTLAAEHGIGAVVDLRAEDCDDPKVLAEYGLRFLHLPTPDMNGVTQPMLDSGVRFVEDALRDGRKVLIHCEHGIGRSAILALCVLSSQGLAPLAALAMAKDARPLISPSEAQYRAWIGWLGRRSGASVPSYHEFGLIAYRHLARHG